LSDGSETRERRHAPAAERNKEPILEVLRGVLPDRGLVLEVASGTGQHTVHFAAALTELTFQPTEREPSALADIRAWVEHAAVANVREPLALDVTAASWPVSQADALFNANMIHIAPWEVCLALLEGAARVLEAGAPLVMYGPYKRAGEHTAPSNAAFDESLRSRDPRWGVRDLDDVVAEAARCGLELERVVQMPANNLTVIYRRAR
jgi:SAM-dependent methyltransferase